MAQRNTPYRKSMTVPAVTNHHGRNGCFWSGDIGELLIAKGTILKTFITNADGQPKRDMDCGET